MFSFETVTSFYKLRLRLFRISTQFQQFFQGNIILIKFHSEGRFPVGLLFKKSSWVHYKFYNITPNRFLPFHQFIIVFSSQKILFRIFSEVQNPDSCWLCIVHNDCSDFIICLYKQKNICIKKNSRSIGDSENQIIHHLYSHKSADMVCERKIDENEC